MRLLKNNNVYDENKYNDFKRKIPDIIPELYNLQSKYKKFNFQSIHPDASKYYSDKKQAIEAIKIAENKLINEYDDYYDFLQNEKNSFIKKLNPLIPLYNLDLYYGL
jgi:hypothetical protein